MKLVALRPQVGSKVEPQVSQCLRAVAVGWRGRACVGCSGAIVGASIGTGWY